ncbi:MAG TPA: histidine kinase [Gaiellaceae bacterium]|nr:histidine kinase [Gaiellaceae bacterium]
MATTDELAELRRALAESEDRLDRERRFGHRVTDATTSLLLLVDEAGVIVDGGVNVAMERLSGWLEHELVGRRIEGIDPATLATADRPLELPYVTRAGAERSVEWTARALGDDGDDERYLLCGNDVTEWRRQQELLRDSRARIVQAADSERRRLERNLHDGAQQRLVSLLLALRLIERRLAEDEELADQVAAARAELAAALEELRELAHGLHPAVLTTHGLGAALQALAARSQLPVELDIELEERPPLQVEAAAYYVVAESVANAQKHAQAHAIRVAVRGREAELEVRVADDGVGGAEPSADSGLVGLVDRVDALGGTLEVESPAGGGTSIDARLPF